MTTRAADIKRRITIPDRLVTGKVSPSAVRAYLRATGWCIASDAPTFFERLVGTRRQSQRSPSDHADEQELANAIGDIARAERRTAGEVLRDIEAMAVTQSMRAGIRRDDLSEIAETIPKEREPTRHGALERQPAGRRQAPDAPMSFRDPKHRMKITFPGPPVSRRVSPRHIESYLKTQGYTPCLSIAREWPKDIPYVWAPPEWPDPRAPPISIKARIVRGPRLCSHPLEQVIEDIALNEGRTPGEVLRDIKTLAKEFARAKVQKPGA
ncbi:hypothetical protein [Sorangium sp. So ce233]|uniref:hypothetical protein n=1 Tax=Sorangium sp. So ce233 TaxID=3133290 RepID=UPI003F6250A9